MTDRLAWTERDAADALGVSERTLRSWRSRRIVPYKRIGGIVLYSPDALRDWVREPYDDRKEDEGDEITEGTPRAVSATERPLARSGATGRRKQRASKPRLPVGLVRG
jgi:hypothetical protein